MKSLSVLDVGSGKNPRGHVNIDIKFYKKTRNFIKANASYLPFRNNSFPYVISNQVIEHVDKPIKMLKEMVRVCRESVIIECPHRFAGRNPNHKNYFNITWFHALLNKLDLSHVIRINNYRSFFPLLQIPRGLTITIHKRGEPSFVKKEKRKKEVIYIV